MRILDCGAAAVLVEFDSLEEIVAFMTAAEAARPSAITDLVPGAQTVLVCFEYISSAAAAAWIRSIDTGAAAARRGGVVEVPVRYDGPDLAVIAELTGLTIAQVISAHTGAEWTCAFGGFAPGFGYLVGGDPMLRVPRRATPRVRVPAGSVALAGEFSGVYPGPSPGGWQLLGHTEITLWDLNKDSPALIRPGTTVRFRSV